MPSTQVRPRATLPRYRLHVKPGPGSGYPEQMLPAPSPLEPLHQANLLLLQALGFLQASLLQGLLVQPHAGHLLAPQPQGPAASHACALGQRLGCRPEGAAAQGVILFLAFQPGIPAGSPVWWACGATSPAISDRLQAGGYGPTAAARRG